MDKNRSDKIEIRLATAEDAAEVADVYLASRKTYVAYAPLAHADAEVRRWMAEIVIPKEHVEVAVIDDQIVGMCATAVEGGTNWINHLYLRPGSVGEGIGSLLLENALERLSRPIQLYTFQENVNACRFYERFGFVAIKFGDGSGNEEGAPDVLYRLD